MPCGKMLISKKLHYGKGPGINARDASNTWLEDATNPTSHLTPPQIANADEPVMNEAFESLDFAPLG